MQVVLTFTDDVVDGVKATCALHKQQCQFSSLEYFIVIYEWWLKEDGRIWRSDKYIFCLYLTGRVHNTNMAEASCVRKND